MIPAVKDCHTLQPGRLRELADAAGLDLKAAKLTMERLKEADRQGYGDRYHPVVLEVIDPQ